MTFDINSIFDHIIDWKEFEQFVAEMYKDSAEVEVQHNVTLIGKYGDKRQVDVLVKQTTKLHTFLTVVECKFLKEKVTRSVIDVLASALDDLNANKGAIITTIGYEAGAVEYARGKNIDIFIIRTVLEEEWGNAGRVLKLWLQFFSGQIEGLSFDNANYFSPGGFSPPKEPFKLDIHLNKEQVFDEKYQLYSIPDFKKGPNLIKVLLNAQQELVQSLNSQAVGLMDAPADGNAKRVFRTTVTFDFSQYAFNHISHGAGYIKIGTIYVNYLLAMSQTKFEHDFAKGFNFVLILENYISKQKSFVTKDAITNQISLSAPIQRSKDEQDLRKGGIIKISTENYVGIDLQIGQMIEKINDVTVVFGNV